MASRVRYKPANTMADLSDEARGAGRRSMQEFLLSHQVQEAADGVAKVIAEDARAKAPVESGALRDSVDAVEGEPMTIDGNPRRVASVVAHGGIYPGATDPESSVAARVIFGPRAENFLREAGEPFNTEKSVLR